MDNTTTNGQCILCKRKYIFEILFLRWLTTRSAEADSVSCHSKFFFFFRTTHESGFKLATRSHQLSIISSWEKVRRDPKNVTSAHPKFDSIRELLNLWMITDILDAICIYILIIALCKLNLPMKEFRAFKKNFPWLILKK